jgi:Amt family ammonium transporter
LNILTQLYAISIIGAVTFTSSYIVLYIFNKIVPLRADEEAEYDGLDIHETGVESYPEFSKYKSGI